MCWRLPIHARGTNKSLLRNIEHCYAYLPCLGGAPEGKMKLDHLLICGAIVLTNPILIVHAKITTWPVLLCVYVYDPILSLKKFISLKSKRRSEILAVLLWVNERPRVSGFINTTDISGFANMMYMTSTVKEELREMLWLILVLCGQFASNNWI